MSDMVALTAIENVGGYLVRAMADGSDKEAREHMAFANTIPLIWRGSSRHSMEWSGVGKLSKTRTRKQKGANTIFLVVSID